tara:strand:+ start:312 stop:506 length:195 start_codon:yes stop_codon:yes gene_type:complete
MNDTILPYIIISIKTKIYKKLEKGLINCAKIKGKPVVLKRLLIIVVIPPVKLKGIYFETFLIPN